MEKFAIPLNESRGPRVRRFRLLQTINGAILLGLALLSSQWHSSSIFFGLYGFIVLVAAALWPLFSRQYQLIIDDYGIRGQVTWRERIDVPWENLAKADLGILFLELHTTAGKVHTVNLGNLTYQEHEELKPKLKTILTEHHLLAETPAMKRLA